MIFLGMEDLASPETLNATATHIAQTTQVKIKNAIWDHLYGTRNIEYDYTTEIPQDWDFDTIMSAYFHGDLHAGNFRYTADQVSHIRIKRRIRGTTKWVTLFEVPIYDEESFRFERFDRFARSNQTYEYALVPVINNAEGEFQTNFVDSQFDGLFISEKEISYGSIADISISTSKNRPNVVVIPVDRVYPYVFGNGVASYYSGTVSAVFLLRPDCCHFDFENSWKYRQDLMDFLCDGRPKLLKFYDGRMYLVSIIESPTENPGEHEWIPKTTFTWAEIGDCEDGHTLYINGLIDVDVG